MEPISCSALGLTGMSACVWVMRDAFQVLYVETIGRVHSVSNMSFMEAHAKCLMKYQAIEVAAEELAETAIEVLAPFME